MRPRLPALLLSVLSLLLAAGCPGAAEPADGTLRVVTTTGLLGDAVAQLAGPWLTVESLMGPGVDPHLYVATGRDAETLTRADLIIRHGLHLEGKLGDVLAKLGRQRPVVAVAEAIPADRLRHPPGLQGVPDPHVWFDVSLWILVVREVQAVLCELDPAHADHYAARADAYVAELEGLHRELGEQLACIPEGSRVLVTAHDAFSYFGAAYGIEVIGLQGISTEADFGVADRERIEDLLVTRRIPAVFVESSVPERFIDAVIEGCHRRGHEVAKGGMLYSDALGAPGTPAATYIGMVRQNAATIIHALTPSREP